LRVKTLPFTLVGALGLALASGCGEFRRGPYGAVTTDAGVDAAPGACGEALGGACNPYSQTGCASGQACVMTIRQATNAVSTYCAIPGTGAYGSRCLLPEACAPGLVCVNNQCRRLCCDGEIDACSTAMTGTTARCQIDIGLGSAGVLACGEVCDWRASTCPANSTCVPFDSDGVASDCVISGNRMDGDPCLRLSDCGQGLLCVGDGSSQVCRAICDTAAASCSGVYSCRPVANRPAGFGVCTF
jgi:hypothetical protein